MLKKTVLLIPILSLSLMVGCEFIPKNKMGINPTPTPSFMGGGSFGGDNKDSGTGENKTSTSTPSTEKFPVGNTNVLPTAVSSSVQTSSTPVPTPNQTSTPVPTPYSSSSSGSTVIDGQGGESNQNIGLEVNTKKPQLGGGG